MSSIHDALKKAQQEKDSLYGQYREIIASPLRDARRTERRSRPIFVTAAVVSILFVVTALAVQKYTLSRREDRNAAAVHREEVTETVTPVREKTAAPPRSVPVKQDARPLPPEKAAEPFDTDSKYRIIGQIYGEALEQQRVRNFTKAEDLYHQILIVDPSFVVALNNLGVIYMQQNRLEAAISVLTRAIELKYDYVDVHYNLACVYARSGDTKKSIACLNTAVELNWDVRNWARNDSDLQNIRSSIGFQLLMGQDKQR